MTFEEFQATKQVISPLTHYVRSGYLSGGAAIKVAVYANSDERKYGYVIEDHGPDTPDRYVVQFEGETVRDCIVDDLEKSLYAYACEVEGWTDSTKQVEPAPSDELPETLKLMQDIESGKQTTGLFVNGSGAHVYYLRNENDDKWLIVHDGAYEVWEKAVSAHVALVRIANGK